jgi:hypothetical protein
VNDHTQQEAKGIDEDVALSSFDLLARVVTYVHIASNLLRTPRTCRCICRQREKSADLLHYYIRRDDHRDDDDYTVGLLGIRTFN